MIKKLDIETIYPVYLKVSEFEKHVPLDEIKERIGSKNLCLAYIVKGEITGFKIGYEKSNIEFYSWIGAVLPEFRRKGIAGKLLKYQESWAEKEGYKAISVKSMNRYPAMLTMLVNSNYKICDLTKASSELDHKIHFIKILNEG